MPNSFDQLKMLKDHVALESDAKDRIRERIALYAALKPSVHAGRAKFEDGERLSLSHFFMSRASQALMACLVMTIAGVGSIRAAEGAVPGDFLYPVKLHVNEEVHALIARSPESKAVFEVSRLNRRLEEVEQLVSEGRLTAEAESQLAKQIGTHSKAARVHIAESAHVDATLAASAIEASLISTIEAHDEVIARIVETNPARTAQPLEVVKTVLQAEILAVASSSTATSVAASSTEPVIVGATTTATSSAAVK